MVQVNQEGQTVVPWVGSNQTGPHYGPATKHCHNLALEHQRKNAGYDDALGCGSATVLQVPTKPATATKVRAQEPTCADRLILTGAALFFCAERVPENDGRRPQHHALST